MSKIIEFFYTNKKKIIIYSSLFLIVLVAVSSFYLINKKYNKTEQEIISEEVEKNTKVVLEEDNDKKENKTIFIDIKGEVVNPGVYELNENERVIDAVNKAGGFTDNAYTRYINLSKKLSDENVIIINNINEIEDIKSRKNLEVIKETENTITITEKDIISNDYIESKTDSKSNTSSSEKLNTIVNINTATKEELAKINGIGESTALKIIEYRESNGKFEKVEDLKNVKGIGDKKYEQIKDYITAE